MAKYFHDAPASTKVFGGGQFDEEWFEMNNSVAYNTVMDMGVDSGDAKEKVKTLAFNQVLSHSLKNQDGTPLQLTRDVFGQLPFELIQPIIAFVNNEDFLAQLSAQKNPEK